MMPLEASILTIKSYSKRKEETSIPFTHPVHLSYFSSALGNELVLCIGISCEGEDDGASHQHRGTKDNALTIPIVVVDQRTRDWSSGQTGKTNHEG